LRNLFSRRGFEFQTKTAGVSWGLTSSKTTQTPSAHWEIALHNRTPFWWGMSISSSFSSSTTKSGSQEELVVQHQEKDDQSGGEFYIQFDNGDRARLAYRFLSTPSQPVVDFYKTETPPIARGKGVGEKLALAGFDWLSHRLPPTKMVLTCSYLVDRVLPQHPHFEKYLFIPKHSL
jgi:predicted GNAT family acetyltransferase